MAVAYIDYSSMEFLIAAVLSEGHCGQVNTMLDMYLSGDPYLAFAKRVGAVPSTRVGSASRLLRRTKCSISTGSCSPHIGIGPTTGLPIRCRPASRQASLDLLDFLADAPVFLALWPAGTCSCTTSRH
jgi:hypothetical protein